MDDASAENSLSIGTAAGIRERFARRFWLLNFQLAVVGGSVLIAAALVVSLLAELGFVPDSEASGLLMTALLSLGPAAWLWAAHAMDRLAALKKKDQEVLPPKVSL